MSKGSETEDPWIPMCIPGYSINAEFSYDSVFLFAEILSMLTKGADSAEEHKFNIIYHQTR